MYSIYAECSLLTLTECVVLDWMHCTRVCVTDKWDLNFAFYLRCVHISQQCMNLRRDDSEGIQHGGKHVTYTQRRTFELVLVWTKGAKLDGVSSLS